MVTSPRFSAAPWAANGRVRFSTLLPRSRWALAKGRNGGTKTRSLVKVERPVSEFESGRLPLMVDEGRF